MSGFAINANAALHPKANERVHDFMANHPDCAPVLNAGKLRLIVTIGKLGEKLDVRLGFVVANAIGQQTSVGRSRRKPSNLS
jgi:hypothetical protein